MGLSGSNHANVLLDFSREKLIFPFSSIYFLPTLNIGQMAIRPQLFKQIKCIENTDEVVITGDVRMIYLLQMVWIVKDFTGYCDVAPRS